MGLSLTTLASASDNLRGVLAMLAAVASFVASDTMVKYAGQELPVGELIFLRALFASFITLSVAHIAGALKPLRQALTPVMAMRTLGEIGATMLYFAALVRMSFADANAIGQFAPLAVTAGAAIFLSEPVGWRRWLAASVGLAGVIIIIRPGTSAFHWVGLLVVGSVMCVAMRDLATRRIDRSLPTLLITAVSTVSVSISGLFLLPFENWLIPRAGTTLLLAGAAVCIFSGYFFIIKSMRQGEIGVVAPFRYSASLFAVVSGYLVFGEVPDTITMLGITIIVAAGIYTLHRERMRLNKAPAKVSLCPKRQ